MEDELVQLRQVQVRCRHVGHGLQFLGVRRFFLELLLRLHLPVRDLVVACQDAPVGRAVEENELPVRRHLIDKHDGDTLPQHRA